MVPTAVMVSAGGACPGAQRGPRLQGADPDGERRARAERDPSHVEPAPRVVAVHANEARAVGAPRTRAPDARVNAGAAGQRVASRSSVQVVAPGASTQEV